MAQKTKHCYSGGIQLDFPRPGKAKFFLRPVMDNSAASMFGTGKA
jgi:hypothetical protein